MAIGFDLSQQRFGRLIALYKCNYKLNNHYPWFCQCDCGNTTVVRTQDLIKGKTKSCGCYQKEIVSNIGKKTGKTNGKNKAKNLTNLKFGRLTAIKPTLKRRGSNVVWECMCDCGNIVYVPTHDLTSKNTCSCGCLKSQGQLQIAKLLNKHNISFVTEKIFDNFVYSDTKGKPRFDFFVNNQYLIEYDGIQHFEENSFFKTTLKDQIKKDNEKNIWCKQQNIPLIRIPYYHLKKIKIEDLVLETSDFII